MDCLSHAFPFIPSDLFGFWEELNSKNQQAYLLGSGAQLSTDHVVFMSIEEPLRQLEGTSQKPDSRILNLGKYLKSDPHQPAIPRFVGYFGFDSGRLMDNGIARLPIKSSQLRSPQWAFAEYQSAIRIDFLKKETVLFVFGHNPQARMIDLISRMARAFEAVSRISKNKLKNKSVRFLTLKTLQKHFAYPSEKNFSKMVELAKVSIKNGDIYQANLSIRFKGRFNKSPLSFYKLLCERNPSPYSCLFKYKKSWIVSCSPELLFSLDGNEIHTRPIAGTRPRAKTTQINKKIIGQLLLSPKERAEHIMLVDLERSDLGRVSIPGSVRVGDQFSIEQYSHVNHIVSDVSGRLEKNKNALDVVKALFPGGTITGCPKIKSIEVIQNLEDQGRGPFYGSAGYFCLNGDAKFNILIRTAYIENKKIYIQSGAGIVADSHPKREYAEVLAKAQALLVNSIEV